MIATPKTEPDNEEAKRFVEGLQQAELGAANDGSNTHVSEIEAVWDAIGVLEAEDFADAETRIPYRYVAGGAIAAMLVLGFAGYIYQRPEVYHSGIGEQKTIILSEGSNITLNTQSRIEVRLKAGKRQVNLLAGEAFFTVSQRPDQTPFYVVTDQARIRVTGTKFNVYRHEGITDVDLLEGRILVASEADRDMKTATGLVAGQAVQIDARGRLSALQPAHTDRVHDWLNAQITFDRTTLDRAVAEMNRYSAVKLHINTSSLESLPVEGVFEAGDVESFAKALHDLHGIAVEKRDGRINLTRSPIHKR